MKNTVYEIEYKGEDALQALIGGEKFIITDDNVYNNFGCNIDELTILEISINGKIEYKVYDCLEAQKEVKEMSHDMLTSPFDHVYTDEEYIDHDLLVFNLIEESDIDELIYEINKTGSTYIKKYDFDQFIESDINAETIKNVLQGNNVFIK